MPITATNFQVRIGGMSVAFSGSVMLAPSSSTGSGVGGVGSCGGCSCSEFTGIRLDLSNGTIYAAYLMVGGVANSILGSAINAALPSPFDYWQMQLLAGKSPDQIGCCNFAPNLEATFGQSGDLQAAYDSAKPRGTTGRAIGALQNQVESLTTANNALQAQVNALRARIAFLEGGEGATAEDINDSLLASLIGGGRVGRGCDPAPNLDAKAGAWIQAPAVKSGCGC